MTPMSGRDLATDHISSTEEETTFVWPVDGHSCVVFPVPEPGLTG